MERQRGELICSALARYDIPIYYSISPTQELILYDNREILYHTRDEMDNGNIRHIWERTCVDHSSLVRREIGAQHTVDFLPKRHII